MIRSQPNQTWGPPLKFRSSFSGDYWTNFNVTIDLAEALQRVQEAAWKEPLDLCWLSREGPDGHDCYTFAWVDEWGLLHVQTGKVTFRHLMGDFVVPELGDDLPANASDVTSS